MFCLMFNIRATCYLRSFNTVRTQNWGWVGGSHLKCILIECLNSSN